MVFNKAYRAANRENKMKYGVFAYDRDTDICIDKEFYSNKILAVESAKIQVYDNYNYWVEVWVEDTDGLCGNSGEAIYNSY